MKINKSVRVFGKVQGVYYRQSTLWKATELGISGWVRNEPDGTVLAELEGSVSDVSEMIAWMKKGPKMALVEKLEVLDAAVKGYAGFKILRD